MGIATERFLAVCRLDGLYLIISHIYSLSYSRPIFYRSLELAKSSHMRLLSYIAPSLLLSIILKIPKFLEAELVIRQKEIDNNTVIEVIDYDVTELRQTIFTSMFIGLDFGC